MLKLIRLVLPFALFSLLLPSGFAVPIDWNGKFGVDATLIDTFRRVDSKTDNSSPGSMEPALAPGGRANASWQSYVFQLNPNLIINDAASIKGEISSGPSRGGILGRDGTQRTGGDFASALYHYNTASSENSIVINQLYAELYADTATYKIGRHSAHWGLGAIYNGGDDLWDRHFSMRDGVTLDMKLGNFFFEPYWSKVSQGTSLTRSTNIKEWGASLLYDNPQQDLSIGILYGVKKSRGANDGLTQDINDSDTFVGLGNTNVKMINIYFAKEFKNFDLGLEVPLIKGDIGDIYQTGNDVDYKARGLVFESNYNLNNWTLGFDAGRITGHHGGTSQFEALYLNPNYQVAQILFRHNLHAISNPELSVYDSYITNANYYKLRAQYRANKWTWDFAGILAQANEVASVGQRAFQHETNRRIANSTTNQSKDMGFELNFGFNYHWNRDITLGGQFAHLFTGDYFEYTGDAGVNNNAKNTYLLQLNLGLLF